MTTKNMSNAATQHIKDKLEEFREENGQFGGWNSPSSTVTLNPVVAANPAPGRVAELESFYNDIGSQISLDANNPASEHDQSNDGDKLMARRGGPMFHEHIVSHFGFDSDDALIAHACATKGLSPEETAEAFYRHSRLGQMPKQTPLSDDMRRHIATCRARALNPDPDRSRADVADEVSTLIGSLPSAAAAEELQAALPHIDHYTLLNMQHSIQENTIKPQHYKELSEALAYDNEVGQTLADSEDEFNQWSEDPVDDHRLGDYYPGTKGDRYGTAWEDKPKAIRADLTYAREKGWLPPTKTMRISSRKNGFTINTLGVPSSFYEGDSGRGYRREIPLPNIREVERRVRSIRFRYGHNRTNSQIDYFDSSFAERGTIESGGTIGDYRG